MEVDSGLINTNKSKLLLSSMAKVPLLLKEFVCAGKNPFVGAGFCTRPYFLLLKILFTGRVTHHCKILFTAKNIFYTGRNLGKIGGCGKQGEGRLLQHGRCGEERGRDGGPTEEIRKREREREGLRKCRCCPSKDKEELPFRATILLFFFFRVGDWVTHP